MACQSQKRRARHSEQRGYVLLTLLLILAVMGIVGATLVTSLKFDIQRDREEEMIHRGVQYSRAIRGYYKKFGRYPATIENLQNTNQIRFLRKRYKDPITGKDFKLLHFGEVKMGLGGGMIPGASTLGANGTLTPNNASNPSFGNNPSFGSNSGFGNNAGFGNNGYGNSNAFGQNGQTQTPQTAQTGDSTTDSQTASSQTASSQTVSSSGTSNDQTSADQPVQQFGGMPIVGVASTSKGPTIREFDKKKKYNEWQFVYDPTLERGLLITTPYQPQLQMFGPQQNLNAPQNQTPGLGTSAPGTTAPPAPPTSNNTLGNPNQPSDTPPQQ